MANHDYDPIDLDVKTQNLLKLGVRHCRRGSSLLEVTVAAGIMGIIIMAFTNMSSQSNRSTAMLSEKINILEFQKNLISLTLS